MLADEDIARDRGDEIVSAQQIRRDAQAGIAESLAKQQETVRAFDQCPHRLRTDSSEIRADELRVSGRKNATAEKRGAHRNSQPLGEPDDLVDKAEAMDFHADNQKRSLCARQPTDDFARRFGDGIVVDLQLDLVEALRNWNIGKHHVAGDLQVDGTLEFARDIDASMNSGGGRLLVVDDGRIFGDLLVDPVLRFERLHFVMDEKAGFALEPAGPSRNDNQW